MPHSKMMLITLLGLTVGSSPSVAQVPQTNVQEQEIIVVRGLRPSRDRLMQAIYIGDLNLTKTADRQEMENRVGRAVVAMCAIPSPIPAYGGEMTKPCRDEAWASARPQMRRAIQGAAGS